MHQYTLIKIGKKESDAAEKLNYTTDTAPTNAVLLHKGIDYKNGISLFPFVVDYSALALTGGSNICFFKRKDDMGVALEFCSLGDKGDVEFKINHIEIPYEDYAKMNELMMTKEKRKEYNFAHVVINFQAAKESLLSEE